MRRGDASRIRAALLCEYPRGDIQVQREFGGLRASVFEGGEGLHFVLGDEPGVLSALFGLATGNGEREAGGGSAAS